MPTIVRQARKVVAAMKAKFNEPISLQDATTEARKRSIEDFELHTISIKYGYCVGGAVVLFADPNYQDNGLGVFPPARKVAEALRKLNKHIDRSSSMFYARGIIGENESTEFESAWSLVCEAIAYRPVTE